METRANVPNDDLHLAKFLEGNLSGLASMSRPASPTEDHLRRDLTKCPSCEECTHEVPLVLNAGVEPKPAEE